MAEFPLPWQYVAGSKLWEYRTERPTATDTVAVFLMNKSIYSLKLLTTYKIRSLIIYSWFFKSFIRNSCLFNFCTKFWLTDFQRCANIFLTGIF